MEVKKLKNSSDRKWRPKSDRQSRNKDSSEGGGRERSKEPENDKKRKREEVLLTEEEIGELKKERSRKKWKKAEEKEKGKLKEERSNKVGNPVQFQKANEQRKYLWNALNSISDVKSMTELELTELKPPKDAFIRSDKESWAAEELDKIIVELLETQHSSNLFLSVPTPNIPFGSPMVLILGRTALRCVELIKHVMPFRKFAHFASLFAKHKKLAEQAKFLQEWHCQLAVGTPNRVNDLISDGSLKLDRLQLVIVDMALDNKTVSILEAFETRNDFLNLYKTHLLPKLHKDTKITFF